MNLNWQHRISWYLRKMKGQKMTIYIIHYVTYTLHIKSTKARKRHWISWKNNFTVSIEENIWGDWHLDWWLIHTVCHWNSMQNNYLRFMSYFSQYYFETYRLLQLQNLCFQLLDTLLDQAFERLRRHSLSSQTLQKESCWLKSRSEKVTYRRRMHVQSTNWIKKNIKQMD